MGETVARVLGILHKTFFRACILHLNDAPPDNNAPGFWNFPGGVISYKYIPLSNSCLMIARSFSVAGIPDVSAAAQTVNPVYPLSRALS